MIPPRAARAALPETYRGTGTFSETSCQAFTHATSAPDPYPLFKVQHLQTSPVKDKLRAELVIYIVMADIGMPDIVMADIIMADIVMASSVKTIFARNSLNSFVRIDMCVNVFIDMCRDMCVNVFIDICIDMRINVSIHMCVDMCIDGSSSNFRGANALTGEP